MSGDGGAAASPADARAWAVEEQMTDDERFGLLVGVMGVNDVVTVRDERIPEGVPMSAGHVPAVPRLGIPALLMSDASLGSHEPRLTGANPTPVTAGPRLGEAQPMPRPHRGPDTATASGTMKRQEHRFLQRR